METVQDSTRSAIESGMPHHSVSCQTCRISRTFVTLQGANAFFDEHDGHMVAEGSLSEGPQTISTPDSVGEVSKPQVEEVLDGIPQSGELVPQEIKPHEREGADPEVQKEAEAPLPQSMRSFEIQPKEQIVAAPSLLSEKDLEEPLLLARSSYIGESDEKRIDALRVSRALKEFKWNVEPPYVIGVMVDDNLSVETNIGVISSSMVDRVEKLGYKFVAINAPQGSPVAWFKRETQQALDTDLPVGDTERMMQIRQGKRTYDKEKAVWEESFVSLLMTVKDMDANKLKHVMNIMKSKPQEPDLQS